MKGGGGGNRLARGVLGWSPESCSSVAGLPRLMIGVRLLLPAGPAVGTAGITGMPDRAMVHDRGEATTACWTSCRYRRHHRHA